MSLNTWKKEFYPVKASSKEALKNPIEHSIRKWKGLRPENIKKHHLQITDKKHLIDSKKVKLFIDESSCACCKGAYDCYDCCVRLFDCFDAYACWKNDVNPEPMIKLLVKALRRKG